MQINLADDAKILVSGHALPAMTGNENVIVAAISKIAVNAMGPVNLSASKGAKSCPLSLNLAR